MEQQIKAIYGNRRILRMILLVAILLVSTAVLIQLVVFHSKINSGFFTYNKDKEFANCISKYTSVLEFYGWEGYGLNVEDSANEICIDQTKRPSLFIESQ